MKKIYLIGKRIEHSDGEDTFDPLWAFESKAIAEQNLAFAKDGAKTAYQKNILEIKEMELR